MKEAKLVHLLKGLQPEDIRQIQKMLRSPFFTTNTNLLTLYSILRSCYPNFESSKLEKQKVFKKDFPKHVYSDIKLRNLNSDLVRIIEDYMIQKEMKANPFERKKLLLKIYKNKKQLDWFGRDVKKLEEEIDGSPYRDHVYFNQKMDLKLLQLEYFERNKPKSRYDLLEEWGNMLDEFYTLSKTRHQIALKSFRKILKSEEEEQEHQNDKENVLLRLYKNLDRLNDNEDLDLFEEIKQDLTENINLIRPSLLTELLTALINFAIKQMYVDDNKFNKIVLELYKVGLEHQIIFITDQDQVSENAFFNIVVCACKAKEFDWVEKFMNDYEKYLLPDSKKDVKIISLSTFYLHKKEFSKAIDLIKTTKFNRFQINVTARIHIIRCYYELFLIDSSYFDLLISQIDSNERFMRRSTSLPESKLKSNLNFLKFVKRMTKERTGGKLKKAQQEAMKKELLNQEITLSRSWLLDVVKR